MFAVCLIQVLALAIAGIVLGLLAGTALPLLGMVFLKDLLPAPPVLGIYPVPLLLAAGYGLLTALAFALWPLGRAARIPGAALFRDALLPEHTVPTWSLVGGQRGAGARPDRADRRHGDRPSPRAVFLRRGAGHAAAVPARRRSR